MEHAPQKRQVEFRFYEELNDFLPRDRRKRTFAYSVTGTPSVKDAIEALGVPHAEVDLILIDGRSVGFTERLTGGERVAVYPVFERLDITPLYHLRPAPLRVTRFLVDTHLGKLARFLRMLGFDAHLADDSDPLAERARREERIILTRNRAVLKRGEVTHGHWVRSTDPEEQLREVVEAMDLSGQFQPFTRCLVCNEKLLPIEENLAAGRIPADVREHFDSLTECPGCRRIYWPGSHHTRMRELIDSLPNSG